MTKELASVCAKFKDIKGKTLIGLTGAIASGKSAALAALKKNGFFCISTDALAKESLTDPACFAKIKKNFGSRVFQKDGSIDRVKLARAVFSDKSKRKRLESILHPQVLKLALALINKSQEKIIIVEVPLLFETGLDCCFDFTVCIAAREKERRKRALQRGWTTGELKRRDSAQLPPLEKEHRADLLILNSAGLKDLQREVKKFVNFILGRMTIGK